MLRPEVGPASGVIFAVALLCAGLASTLTAAMAGGSIIAGIFGQPFDERGTTSRADVLMTLVPAPLTVFFVTDTFWMHILSQMILSI